MPRGASPVLRSAPEPGKRDCRDCGERKPLSEFYWTKTSGRSARCKECKRAAGRERYAARTA